MSLSFLELQNRIRAALPPSYEACAISQFVHEYRKLHGDCLPFEDFGYNSARDLLESMREVALVTAHPNGFVSVQAATDSDMMDLDSSSISERPRRRRDRRPRKLVPQSAETLSDFVQVGRTRSMSVAEYAAARDFSHNGARTKPLTNPGVVLTKELLLAEIRRSGSMRIAELDLFCVRCFGIPLSLENANQILGTSALSRHQAFRTAFVDSVHVTFDTDGNHVLTAYQVNTKEIIVDLIKSSRVIQIFDLAIKAKKRLGLDLTLEFLNKVFNCDASTLLQAYEIGLRGRDMMIKPGNNGNASITYVGVGGIANRFTDVKPEKLHDETAMNSRLAFKRAILEEIHRCGTITLKDLEKFSEETLRIPLTLQNCCDMLQMQAPTRQKVIEMALRGKIRVVMPKSAADDVQFIAIDACGRKVKNLQELFVEIVRRNGRISHFNLKSRLLLEHNKELTLETMNKAFGTQKNNPIEIVKDVFPGVIAVSGVCVSPGKELFYSYVKDSPNQSLDEEKPVIKQMPKATSPPSSAVRPEYRAVQLLADYLTNYMKEQGGIKLFVTEIGRVLFRKFGHIPQFHVPTDYDDSLKLAKHLVTASNKKMELTYVNELGFLKLTQELPIGTNPMRANTARAEGCRIV